MFVVVPAYNEEKKIGRVIRGLFEHGYNQVVVVDDGSLDNTVGEAQVAGAEKQTRAQAPVAQAAGQRVMQWPYPAAMGHMLRIRVMPARRTQCCVQRRWMRCTAKSWTLLGVHYWATMGVAKQR